MNIIQQLEAEQAAKIEAKRTLPEFPRATRCASMSA